MKNSTPGHLANRSTRSNKLMLAAAIVPALIGSAMADGDPVVSAVSGVTAQAGQGVAAGIGIGVVLFGARVVWRAIKGMAK